MVIKRILIFQLRCSCQLQNADGTWVKLDLETVEHYCHETEGEAWSLSRGPDGMVYLQHEGDLITTPDVPKTSPFSMGMFPGAAASPSQKGYDFTSAQHHPTFSVFGPGVEGKNARIYQTYFLPFSFFD